MGMKDINEILNTNYEDFIRPFPIYPTWRSARKKGYEAHHIIPRTVQEKEKGKVYDDRCIRVTCFEHILAHYLYCRDYPEESSQFLAFNLMCYENAKELLEDEKKFLEELPYFAEMREKGLHQISEGKKGKQCSEETRKKISEATKGENNPNYGKQCSEETRKKISEGNKGKQCSEETRKKISEAKKGKQRSEETRKKISEAQKGENSPNAKKVFQYDINGNIIQIFPTVKDTCIILGKGEATINRYLHGKAPKNLPYTLSYN